MILVTGATGFLGAEVALQLLRANNLIRCIKRSTSVIPEILKPYSKAIQWFDADLLDADALEDALEGITNVYNCAAFVSLKQTDKAAMIYTNVTGTANLVNICLEKNIRLVHVSSIAAIGLAKPAGKITEEDHLDTETEDDGYALSKLESEMEVWRGVAEGLSAVIVNPSIIIGADAGPRGSGQLFETVRKGLKVYTNGFGGFVDVEDVAKCMIILMNSDISGERYIISAENRSYRDMVNEIADGFGINRPTIYAKPWMMEFAWRAAKLGAIFTGGNPALDKVSAQAATQHREFDTTKIKQATGIEFKPISISIKEICARLSVPQN